MIVVSTALNPRAYWRIRCERSVKMQTVPATHIYIDAEKEGGTCIDNLCKAILPLPPDEIVAWVDGDDWLAHERVLERVEDEYELGAWMTWGQFRMWPDGEKGWASDYSAEVHASAGYRRDVWRATHLKTFRAGLFQRIPTQHFILSNMKPITRAVDMAVMYPMLEMARERGHFIRDVLYYYNVRNPMSAHNNSVINEDERLQCRYVRGLPPLARLEERPW